MAPRVLIIDDDAIFLAALCELLAAEMPRVLVTTLHSAEGAMSRVQQHDYDAIVSDIRMPLVDGLTLMGRIHEVLPNTPLILMTAEHDRALGLRALKQGAYAFLAKPIDTELFVASLDRALHVRELSRELKDKTTRLEQQTHALEQAVRERTLHLQTAIAAIKEAEHVNRHLAALVESSEDAILSNTPSGVIQTWNHGAEQLYGYHSTEVLGKHISLLMGIVTLETSGGARKRVELFCKLLPQPHPTVLLETRLLP